MTRAWRAEPDLPPGPARDLVDLFKRLRRGRDRSGGQVAAATGLSPSHVSEVLRGVTAPSPGAAARIARALGATEDQARRARYLAEQLGELNRYHRTHRTAPTTADRASPSGSAAAPHMDGRRGRAAPPRHAPGAEHEVMRPVVDVFPVAIGYYTDAELADLDMEAQAGRLVDLLAPFGGRHRPWRHPARDRGADAVQHRLNEWSGPPAPAAEASQLSSGSSVLWWAGHGWTDGTRTALAHARSPAVVDASGLEPQQLAQAIRARQAGADLRRPAHASDGWALVILETEHAAEIADAVMAALHGPGATGRLLLVAVPRDDVSAGGFVSVLANLLADTYRADHRILLRDLAAQLERVIGPSNVHQRALGEAALIRTWPPVASWLSAPVETIRHLEDVLAGLSPDERSHFLAKAQGAEHGELSWFFEGREHELARVSDWLHQASSGMLVVTGRAGSGKSALLGTVLVRSLPALRDALARRGLVAAPGPGAATPPESVFDGVVHLSGLDLAQATARVASAAGIGPLPSHRDRDAGIATDLDFLAAELTDRAGPFTVLADALDESLDPLDIARALLARIAALPAVRILIGTRASTSEAPDTPAGDENLLDALGTSTPGPGEPDAGDPCRREPGRDRVIWVGQDQQAIGRYVTGRLRAARDYGVGGRVIPHMCEVSDDDIQRAAREVAERGQEFLFARLAVYELIADPRLLTPGLAHSRGHLLQGTHQDLFERALNRLAGHDDRYPLLMRALSLARGRGVPEADGIWATIAAALLPAPAPPPAAAWAGTISSLLSQAAAYITADTDCGGPARTQTVYRLAHYTFVEYFVSHPPGRQDSDTRKLAATALLRTAAQAVSADRGRLPAYLVRHLSGHAAEAGMWDDLAALPRVLDHIDPNAVTTDAIRTLFGRRAVPPPIAGIIGARDTLAAANSADRPGLRQLATTIHSSRHVMGERAGGWGIAAARAGRSTVHVRLTGHAGAISRVRSLTLPDGRTALASAGADSTIRLWDPVTATPVGVLMKGHARSVEDICLLPGPGGATLLASAGADGTVRLWDLATGQTIGPPLTGHSGPVWGVCAVPSAPGQPSMLASVGSDGTVRLWNPATGQTIGGPMTGHTGPVPCVCAVPGRQPGHPAALATAGFDGTVRLWDLTTGQPAGPPLTGHAGSVYGVCAVPGQPSALASAGDDGTVRLWDLATSEPAGPPLTGHAGPVWSVCAVPGQPSALASAGGDGTVRLWDLATGQPAGPPLTGHAGPVWGVCAVPGQPGQPPILASSGDDGTVRLWDLATSEPAGPRLTCQAGPFRGVCAVPGQPPALASAANDGTVRLWDPATGQPAGPPLTGHAGPVMAVCVVPGRQPGQLAALASAGNDGTVRLWDPATGQPAGPPLTGHTGPVRSICAAPGRASTLASAGNDGTVRLWDLATGQPTGPPLTGHTGPVLGICAVPGRASVLASAGNDGTVRLWDLATGQPADPPGNAGPFRSVCSVPGQPGQLSSLATAGDDGTVRLWDASGQPVGPPLTGHPDPAQCVCAVPGTQPGGFPVLASGGVDGTVRLWDLASGQPAGPPLAGHAGPVAGVCALPGQPLVLATAGDDGTLRLWDAATGQAVGEPLARSPEAVHGLAPLAAATSACVTRHGDGTVRTWTAATATLHSVTSAPEVSAMATLTSEEHASLLAGDIYGRLHLSDLGTGRQQGSPLRVDDRAVLAICPLPGPPPAARAAAAGSSGTITIVTITPGGHLEPGPILRGHHGPIRALCLITQPAGRTLLAAAGNDASITIWDLTTTAPRVTSQLAGHTGWIWSLAAIPGKPGSPPRLASAGADHTIRIWEPASGHSCGQPLTGHTGQVRTVTTATSDDGHVVMVSGGHDGTIRLWDPIDGAPGAVIPLGIPVHALLQQPSDLASRERTGGGATITAGLRTGILALDLHRDLFQRQSRSRRSHPRPDR